MKTKCFFSGIIATLALFLIHLILYPYLFTRNVGNLTYYVVISVIFVTLFFFSLYCLEYFKKDRQIDFGRMSIWFSVGFLFWFILMYFSEKDSYYFFTEYSLRHRIPYPVYFLSLILFTVLIYFIISLNKIINLNILRIVFILSLSVLQTIALAAPNIINDRGGNLFHIHAYFNPIYNVYNGIPYDEYLSSIYGHYPFFYYIPMKILSLFNISLVHSAMTITLLFGFISFIFLYLGLSRFIKNNGLFFISALAASYISFYYYQSGQYYQMVPHRILFPSITIFIFSVYIYKKIPVWVSVLASSLALLWNFESGILCLIAITVFMIIQYCFNSKAYDNYKNNNIENKKVKTEEQNKKNNKVVNKKEYSLGISLALVGLSFVLSFVIAIILMNIFNIFIGGKIRTIVDLCYPLMSKDDYELSEISIGIPSAFNIFFIEFVLFLFIDCYLFIKIIKRNIEFRESVIFSISLLGLGLLPYYFNRAAFSNVAIVHIPFVTVLGICFEQYVQDNLNKWKKVYVISVSLILAFFTLGALSGVPLTYKNRTESSWQMDTYSLMCEIMEEYIPQDTPAVGPGLPDIYTSLGWDPVINVMDWSDWNCSKGKKEYALNEIDKQNSILLCNESGVREELDMEDWITTECFFDEFSYMEKVQNGSTKKADIISFANEFDYTDEEYIDLCILNCYNVYLSEDITNYYNEMFKIVKDREVIYDFILEDFQTDKFGLSQIASYNAY